MLPLNIALHNRVWFQNNICATFSLNPEAVFVDNFGWRKFSLNRGDSNVFVIIVETSE